MDRVSNSAFEPVRPSFLLLLNYHAFNLSVFRVFSKAEFESLVKHLHRAQMRLPRKRDLEKKKDAIHKFMNAMQTEVGSLSIHR